MNNKKILIASSSKDEAITKWVINSQKRGELFDVLFIEELLNKYDIQDEIDDKQVSIQWYENNVLRFSNKTHCLLNRITYIERTLFDKFKPHDREYAKREFEAYLGFSLNSFKKVQKIAINGVCERIYSLPQQWKLLKNKTEIPIPNYYWGMHDYAPFISQENRVCSNSYNYLNWSPASSKDERTGFCFERPKGEPIFVLSIGTSRLISSEIQLNPFQSSQLDKLLGQIRELYNYFIFELLIFVDGNKLTFGCINLDVIRSQHNKLFSDFLKNNLLKEFYKCLN